ncbi:MAG: helix-turn-helix domain-containing protein [Prevotella sp.]|nr:helix-turn-helix domain-containing protein [Prevotella sp.]
MDKKFRYRLGALMLLWVALALPTLADDPVIDVPACPAERIEPLRLPDLNLPRAAHSVFVAGGELVAVGGHTSGFVLTETAEYLSNGEWHVVPTAYSHDAGFSVVMKSGRVLIGGGYEKNLGIGQIFSVEWYDPATYSFEGFGCLDAKRAQAQGLELDSGLVLVSGNWYHDDSMELFDGQKFFTLVDSVTLHRSMPYLFLTAKDNAVIMGSWDTRGYPYEGYPTTVDRLKGGPVDAPFLSMWMPLPCPAEHRAQDSFIGDEERDIYAYLMAVCDLSGTKAIALVRNGEVERLPTDCFIPTEWENTELSYISSVVADRQNARGYMVAMDRKGRFFVLCVDYADAVDGDCRLTGRPARLTLLYTDVLGSREDWPGYTTPVLTPDGDLVLVGGAIDDNFAPSRAVWLFPVGSGDHAALTGCPSLWPWVVAAVAVLLLLVIVGVGCYWLVRCRRTSAAASAAMPAVAPMTGNEELMQRICQVMEQERLFLKSGLKVSDVAAALGTNSRYVTACINSLHGCSFSQFVNGYRIGYAQQLMRSHPDKKMTEVWISSGFANETSFFRTFKAVVGTTPKEWMQRLDETK